MKARRILLSLMAALGLALTGGAAAADKPGSRVKPNFSHVIPDIPGKSFTTPDQ